MIPFTSWFLAGLIIIIGIIALIRRKPREYANRETQELTKRRTKAYYAILLLVALVNALISFECYISRTDVVANAMFIMIMTAIFEIPLLLVLGLARLWLLRPIKRRALTFDIHYFALPVFYVVFSQTGWANGGLVSTALAMMLALYEFFGSVRDKSFLLPRTKPEKSGPIANKQMTGTSSIYYRSVLFVLLVSSCTIIFVSLSTDIVDKQSGIQGWRLIGLILLVLNFVLGLVRWLLVKPIVHRSLLLDMPYFVIPIFVIIAWLDIQLSMVLFLSILAVTIILYEFIGSLFIRNFLLFRNVKTG